MFNKSAEIKERHWTRLWDRDRKEEIIKKFRENRLRQRIPSKATKIEKIMEGELKKRNISFITHAPTLNICQPDIVFPQYKLAVQCDGDWWHANTSRYNYDSLSKIQKNNVKRDKYQDRRLKEHGWYIIRFWETEIKENICMCVDKIEKIIKQRGYIS